MRVFGVEFLKIESLFRIIDIFSCLDDGIEGEEDMEWFFFGYNLGFIYF